MCLSVLPACLCVQQMCTVPLEGKERMTDQLETELQIVASCHVGTGNQNRVLRLEHGSSGRAASAINHWSISLALGISF